METTIKLKAAELGPAVLEAIQLLIQGNPTAEITITVRLQAAVGDVVPAKTAHLGSATPGDFSANFLAAANTTDEDDLTDPFGDMTRILK
jgi:hypothetical protein